MSGNTFYRPTAVNTGYVGNVQANGRACIEISDETNLGGNPTSFQTRGLDLAADCGLRPLASCTLDDANRGLTVSNGYVNVDADKVLTLMLNSRILAGASFKKRGAGVLALGGVNQKITPYGTIAVEAGTLKALSSDAAKYAKLSFADGAAFAIDHVADTADARSTLGLAAVRGCTLEGDSLPVTVALPEDAPAVVEQPLLTVAAGEADAVAAKLDVAKPKGYAVEILQTPTTYDGVASVTLTAKFRKRGWALIIR